MFFRIKQWLVSAVILGTLFFHSSLAQASPWTQKDGYLAKTGGKFVFGLKHSLFSWFSMWSEADEPQYEKKWQGFCVGLGKTLIYTPTGLIQLATFPIPVDFPNIGIGLHIPNKNCPACHWDYKLPEETTYARRSSKKQRDKTAFAEAPQAQSAPEMEEALKEQISESVAPEPPVESVESDESEETAPKTPSAAPATLALPAIPKAPKTFEAPRIPEVPAAPLPEKKVKTFTDEPVSPVLQPKTKSVSAKEQAEEIARKGNEGNLAATDDSDYEDLDDDQESSVETSDDTSADQETSEATSEETTEKSGYDENWVK